MIPQTRFYQIGGFKAHSHAWRQYKYDREGDEGLARAIAGDKSPLRSQFGDSKGIELILGIRPSGASYLLMNEEQMRVFTISLRLAPPRDCWLLKDFLSLSPIHFKTVDELSKKLKTYSQKSNKHKGGEINDNSQANRTYEGRNAGDSGASRAAFEHSRVLFKILRDDIDCFKFGLPYPQWTNSIRFVSLTFNTWSMDERNQKERLNDPKVLDIGWTEVAGVGSSWKRDLGASVHITVEENRMLANLGSPPLAFEHGTPEVLNLASLASRLKELFVTLQESKTTPVILLVHDEELTKSVLRCARVDLSQCKIGIKNLLYHQDGEGNARLSREDLRSRSRSPCRHVQNDAESKSPTREFYSGHSHHLDDGRRADHTSIGRRARQYAPIYVIDVQSLYRKLTQTDGRGKNPPGKDVAATARELLLPGSTTGWCAGNECGMLVDIWRSLADGPPIDEQRTIRQAAAQIPNMQPAASSSGSGAVTSRDSDDEVDPNNANSIPFGLSSGDPYEDLEDDDDY